MTTAAVDDYLAGKHPDGIELFRQFERMVEQAGDVEASVSRTVVYFKRRRVFAGAFVRGRRLEIVIDLLRQVEHPCLLASFATTKQVFSHRFRISEPSQLDDSIAELLREAYEQVGPGTTRRRG